MRNLAKFLSLILALATIASFCVPAVSAGVFEDVKVDAEALYEAVELLSSLGVAKGTSSTKFSPSKDVTREQMAAFIYRLMNKGKSIEGGENLTKFEDLDDDTFYYMISWADAKGIIKGRSETEFDPSGDITLQDGYVMLVRALGYESEGALGYPYGYIDIAEQIDLDENLSADITYGDTLTRGDVAIILYNAFYAPMKEEYLDVIYPSYVDGSGNVVVKAANQKVKETVCHKVYGIKQVTRRIVATPNYALDLTELANKDSNLSRTEYTNYAPLDSARLGDDYIETAAIVPGESAVRLTNEKSVIKFSDLGLDGDADDYFLSDIVLYLDSEGNVFASSAKGGKKDPVSQITVNKRTINDWLDYYNFYDTNPIALFRGTVSFASGDTGYLFGKPSSVPNYMYSICPVANDEGRITFKADYAWYGDPSPYFERNMGAIATKEDYNTWLNQKRTLHDQTSKILGLAARGSGLYNVDYYDTNGDGIVEYFWFQPYTFGWVVDRGGNKTTTRLHTGDSKYRAVFNSTEKRPEIVITDAVVEGNDYKVGNYALAYVSGPANLVKFAPASVQSQLVSHKNITYVKNISNNNNSLLFSNGFTAHLADSDTEWIVGHINNANTGILPLHGVDVQPFGDDRFNSNSGIGNNLGDCFNIISIGARVIFYEKTSSHTINIPDNYAIVKYINPANRQVVFEAGGIQADGTLKSANHVQAFIGGEFKLVEIADYFNDNINDVQIAQNNNYFTDNTSGSALIDDLLVYSIEKGKYIFKPIVYNADASKLVSPEDDSHVYTNKTSRPAVIKQVTGNVYQFVSPTGTVPSELAPNGMKYFMIDDKTQILIKFVNAEGYDDYVVYNSKNLPKFDINRVTFSKTAVVLRNNTEGTQTEYLDFLYAEIGGEIIQDKTNDKNYAIILDVTTYVDDNGKVVPKYDIVNPFTGERKENVGVANSQQTRVLNKYEFYQLTTDGLIQNTDDEADFAFGSVDFEKIVSFTPEVNLISLTDGRELTVDENTVYALLDRSKGTLTIEDKSMLLVKKADDADNKYYNTTGPDQNDLTVYVMDEQKKDQTMRNATLIIVARG